MVSGCLDFSNTMRAFKSRENTLFCLSNANDFSEKIIYNAFFMI